MADDFDFEDDGFGSVRRERNGFQVTIAFAGSEHSREALSVSDYRDELLQLIEVPECATVIFDLTGVSTPPSGLVGLLASARDRSREVEVLNPSPEIQEVLRMAQLDSCLLIRGTSS